MQSQIFYISESDVDLAGLNWGSQSSTCIEMLNLLNREWMMNDLWTLKQHDFLPQKPLGMADIGCCSSPYLESRDVLNISVL